MRLTSTLASLLVVGAAIIVPQAALAATAPAGFAVQTVVSGLTLPTGFAFAADGRIFVAQKGGSVRVIQNGALLPTPVVTLPDVNDWGDRGLEGIALDPNFAQNGYLYLAYTHENTPGQNYQGDKTGRIVRLTVTNNVADLGSEVVLLGSIGGDAAHPSCRDFATTSDCIPSDASTHSMGALRFGPDGKLYATLGDGADYTTVDPLALDAQDVNSLGGKIVRINTDGTAPSDNPYYDGNSGSNRSKVWALGLRNAYRFNWAPDGTMFFGDVGWATWEEIDVGQKGANYGWPCREGFVATSYNCTPSSAATNPIYVYDHSSGSGSVMGGAFPTWAGGDYIFGDYSNDYLKRMAVGSGHTNAGVSDFITGAGGPVDIQTGPDGNLYYAAINVGELRKVVSTGGIVNGPNQGANPAPHLTATTVAPDTVIGHQETITAAVTNTGGTGNFIVDIEVVNANAPNTLIAQQVYDPVSIAQGGSQNFTLAWLPPGVGNYIVKVGLFAEGWASLYEWDQPALTITVTDRSPSATAAAPHFTVATQTPAAAMVGTQETLTATLANSGGAGNFVTDLEIYDAGGHQVAQQVYDPSSIAQGGSHDYTIAFTPAAAGTYTLKVGLFTTGWQQLLEWTDQAKVISVGGTGPTQGAPKFDFTSTASPASTALGGVVHITTTVTNTGGAGDALVDIEVVKGSYLFGQDVINNQHFAAGESKTYTYDFTVPQAGQYGVPSDGLYTVNEGVMHTDWSAAWVWHDNAANFSAMAGQGGGGGPAFTLGSTSVTPSSPTAGGTAHISAAITDTGSGTTTQVDVQIIKDGYLFGRYTPTVTFSGGAAQSVQYDFAVPAPGQYGVSSSGTYHVNIYVLTKDGSGMWAQFPDAATFIVP